MRKLLLLFVLALLSLAAATPAGTYIGTWSGAASGDFRLVLEQSGDTWKADVVFTLGTDEVKTVVKSVKVDGNKINVIYQYDLQGTTLQSNVTGELTGKTISGTYIATAVGDGSAVDEGTWKVSAK
jgi:protein-disulfide isomerase